MISFTRRFGALTLLALVSAGIGYGSDPCTGWTYGGGCGDNKAQFIRTCHAPNGGERIERRCTKTCGP